SGPILKPKVRCWRMKREKTEGIQTFKIAIDKGPATSYDDHIESHRRTSLSIIDSDGPDNFDPGELARNEAGSPYFFLPVVCSGAHKGDQNDH
ncbi:MAG: hypothetical protein ACREBQ_06450, partial [Nitrososphaerales archaeon]